VWRQCQDHGRGPMVAVMVVVMEVGRFKCGGRCKWWPLTAAPPRICVFYTSSYTANSELNSS